MTRQATETNVIGTRSAGNRTFEPLGANETFEGTFEDITNVASISIIIVTDVDTAPDGLKIIWSSDGIEDDFIESVSITGLSGLLKTGGSISPKGDFFRISWTNGAIAQTKFKLAVTYHSAGSGLTSRSLKLTLTDNNFAQTVRSVLAIKKIDGNYINAKGNADGHLEVHAILYGEGDGGEIIPIKVTNHGKIKVKTY